MADIARVLEIISYVVTASATGGLFIYAKAQMDTNKQDRERHNGRLDAVATRYAMLVRRSLRECVGTLDDNDPSKGDAVWTNAMASTAQALGGPVQDDLHRMLDTAIERSGGAAANLQEILDRYLSACDSIDKLAAGGGHMEAQAMKTHRDNARKSCIQCWGAIEREFGFEAQHPHSFGTPREPKKLSPG